MPARECGSFITGPATSATDSDVWNSVSMDFVFGLLADAQGRTDVLVIVGRFSKMVHLALVTASITAEETAALFVDLVF